MIKEITKRILSSEITALDQIEVREIFDEIYQGISNEISSTAFIVALEKITKTEELLQAAIEASNDAVIKPFCNLDNLFQTINLAPNEKYLDIFFALDVINSANNIKSIKYATEKFNNSKAFKKYGNKIEKYSQNIVDYLEENNFLYYYLNSDEKYLKYTNAIRKNLEFENIFDFIDNFLNPFNIKNQLIGADNSYDIQKIAQLALMLKYENTIAVKSPCEIPYAVLEGENHIAEAWKNKIFSYTLDAKLLDLPTYTIDKIKVENDEESLEIIENVFNNKIKDAPYYTIILNSALALYISKSAPSLIDGIKLAQKTIDEGKAKEKLEQIKTKIAQ